MVKSSEGNDCAMAYAQSNAADSQIQQTTAFADENAGDEIIHECVKDNSFFSSYTSNVELADFLKRPVLIHTLTWTENADFDDIIRPWFLYFNNASIKRKLDNYAFLNCTLHLKIMINASPFYYGAAIAAYCPLPVYNPGEIVEVVAYDGYLVPLSQRPHVWIYPQTNQGGELKVPFLYYKDWLKITDLNEFNEMDELRLRSYTLLDNANGVTGTGCTIQVFAWAEDVRVSGPTVDLALQSGRETDEYSMKGVISKPASAVAAAAGLLSEVPVIGPYATATSMVAGTLGSVAAWFGYTKTPVIEDVMPMKNLPFHSLASSEIGQPIEKLALDPKNEVTIDPKIVGCCSEDEMTIDSIVARESWFYTISWSQADPVDTRLFAMRIMPNIVRLDGLGTGKVVQSTPLAYIGRLFRFWKGDIVLRFRFICTKFHRGRVRITWDPVGDIQSTSDTNTVAFNRIVDISSESDIEIKIPYTQAVGWCKRTSSYLTQQFGTSTGQHVEGEDNGTLTMRIFTSLTAPVATGNIKVLVSVRGENMEFAGPDNLPNTLAAYAVQSGREVSSRYNGTGKVSVTESKPQFDGIEPDVNSHPPDRILMLERNGLFFMKQPKERYFIKFYGDFDKIRHLNVQIVKPGEFKLQSGVDTVTYGAPMCASITGKDQISDPNSSLIYNGEKIKSLRQLLRRASLSRVVTTDFDDTNSVNGTIVLTMPRLPLYPGFDPNGVHTADTIIAPSGSAKYNFVNIIPLTYMSLCYVGTRGGIEWHINVDAPKALSTVRLERSFDTRSGGGITGFFQSSANSSSVRDRQSITSEFSMGSAGVSLINQHTQTGSSAVVPYYSQYRMIANDPLSRTLGSTKDGSDIDTVKVIYTSQPFVSASNNPRHVTSYLYVNIGTDFSFQYFLNCPSWRWQDTVPTAV